MQAVVLAAGQGKRLRPLTNDIPKVMLKINGKPLLQIILEQLKSVGISDIVVVVHYKKDTITDYFGDGEKFGLKITYVEQKEMKGTGDAVLQAEQFISEDKFICIAGDSLFETDLLQRIIDNPAVGVMTCKEVADGRQFGVLEMDGDNIKRIIEKSDNPPSNLANFSVYKFPKRIFEVLHKIPLSPRGEYEVTDAIQLLIDEGVEFKCENAEKVVDIGSPEQLEEAQKFSPM